MIKIVGLCGSPRRQGNSEILLDMALKGAAESGAVVEKIILNNLSIKPTRACAGRPGGESRAAGDDMRLIYRKFEQSDGLIIASPVYFGSLTAQLKAVIDGFQPYYIRKYVLKRPTPKKRLGIFLCVAGRNNKRFFYNARSIIKILFLTLDVGLLASLFCGGVDKKGAVKKDKASIKEAYELGGRLAKRLEHA